MGGTPSAPTEEQTEYLLNNYDLHCQVAAKYIEECDALIVCTGAGFSADSGLAVYRDIATIKPYQDRSLTYSDLCVPDWLRDEPGLFYGFWGLCFNDYRDTQPHKGYDIILNWRNQKQNTLIAKAISDTLRNSGLPAHNQRCITLQQQHTKLSALLQTSASTPGAAQEQLQKYQLELREKLEEIEEFLQEEKKEYVDTGSPYEVQQVAGAFFMYTSNVDAHAYDYLHAHEIRECHGNVETWQCAKGVECTDTIWRAPFGLRFNVDRNTMHAHGTPPQQQTTTTCDNNRRERWSTQNGWSTCDKKPTNQVDKPTTTTTTTISTSQPQLTPLQLTPPQQTPPQLAPASTIATVKAETTTGSLSATFIACSTITPQQQQQLLLLRHQHKQQPLMRANTPTKIPTIGQTTGSRRKNTLQHMPNGVHDVGDVDKLFQDNRPTCFKCGGPARPAILMFGDSDFLHDVQQDDRWASWKDALYAECLERKNKQQVKVTVLEIGCGGNVKTVRRNSQHLYKTITEDGGLCKVVRINPDLPLRDNDDIIDANDFVSIMSKGLVALENIEDHRSRLSSITDPVL